MNDQIKDLQAQILLLQQQMQLSVLQQTQQLSNEQAVLTALKSQVTAQSDLDKAQAQGAFAKLAGMKAGLDSVGPPPAKEGKINITTGTSGALMLKLKGPMLNGLYDSSIQIAKAVKAQTSKLNGGIVVATDVEIQAALQSKVTRTSINEVAQALDASVTAVQGANVSAAVFAEAAAAGLFLRTVMDFSKFFRVDRTDTLFDAGEEANQVLRFLVENRLVAEGISLVNLSDVLPDEVEQAATDAQKTLNSLSTVYDNAAALLTNIDKMLLTDPKRPATVMVDRLRADAAGAKEILDALHPARKPEGFWAYVKGCCNNKRMSNATGEYLARIALNVKAQTIQVTESRTWRSDKIYGSADVQIDYRIVNGKGFLLVSEILLLTFDDSKTIAPLYFPPRPTQQ